MLRHLIYLKLQLKSALLCIPKLLAGTLLFSCLAAFIGYAGAKTLYHSDDIFYFRIAAVLPEDDALVNMGFNMLTSMDSLKDYCEFIRTDESTAKRLLKNGEVYGIVYIPTGFVEDIMNGKNTPAHILLADSSGIETVLFSSVLNAGSDTLAYVQSGIYALSDTYSSFGIGSLTAEASDRLNKEYLRYTLHRGDIFDTRTVSSTGVLSLPQFFVCAGAAVVMLFLGFTLGSYTIQESPQLGLMLKRSGISYGFTAICKTIILSLFYTLLFVGLSAIAKVLQRLLPTDIGASVSCLLFDINIKNLAFIALCSALSVSYITAVFNLAGNGLYGMLLLFLLNTLMLFSSGCIIPSAYLPKAAAGIGTLLPTAYLRQCLSALYTGSLDFPVIAGAAIYIAVFTAISGICSRRTTSV